MIKLDELLYNFGLTDCLAERMNTLESVAKVCSHIKNLLFFVIVPMGRSATFEVALRRAVVHLSVGARWTVISSRL